MRWFWNYGDGRSRLYGLMVWKLIFGVFIYNGVTIGIIKLGKEGGERWRFGFASFPPERK